MKSCLILPLLLLLGLRAPAQAPVLRVEIPVREVTLFSVGAAELRHEVRATLPAGLSTVRLTGLAPGFDLQSLQATVGAGAELVSTDVVPADRPAPPDSAARLRARFAQAEAEVGALQEEKNLLIANRELRGATATTWNADIGRLAAAFRERMRDVLLRLDGATQERNRLQQDVSRLRPTATRAAPADVLLRIRTRAAGAVPVSVAYQVEGSSIWAPQLALRVGNSTETLKVESTVRVVNNSGVPWAGVRLTLVSSPASHRVKRPNLQPWVARLLPKNDEDDTNDEDYESAGEGRLDDFAVKGTSTARPTTTTSDSLSAPGDAPFTDRFRVPGRPFVPVGQPTEVAIETLVLPLRAEYYVVPKLDPAVLLVGKVSGLQRLKAPTEEASVYVGGNYVGLTQLNTRAFNDSVEVALGVDPQVVVSRTKRADKTSRRLLGGKQKIALGYEINLRNGRTTSVRVRVADQIPVPLDKEIIVNVTETSGAVLDAESGRLTWVVELKPGQSRALAFAFTVESPEGQGVNLDKRYRSVRSPKFR